jgi:hypothetical protein
MPPVLSSLNSPCYINNDLAFSLQAKPITGLARIRKCGMANVTEQQMFNAGHGTERASLGCDVPRLRRVGKVHSQIREERERKKNRYSLVPDSHPFR